MTVTGLVTAVIFGLIIGALARLVLPGKQDLPIWLTILIGIFGALVGTFIARAVRVPTSGFNLLELILQIGVAAAGVALCAGAYGRRGIRG